MMFLKNKRPSTAPYNIQDESVHDPQKSALQPPDRSPYRRRRRVFTCLLVSLIAIVILAIALGVGLGVGLTRSHNDDNNPNSDPDSSSSSSSSSSTTPLTNNSTTNNGTTNTANGTVWQPAVGTPWQIVLLSAISNTSIDVPIYDIDAFDNNASTISTLHSQNRKVICYFSAGTYENWRPDASRFPTSAMGNGLDGWPGEKWLNVTDPTIRSIMSARIDMAKSKGCDGVDPDNVDGYDNDNGLNLTTDQAVDYVNWLADQAQSRGMSVGLKNAGGIIAQVIDNMQWSVNEQCVKYGECDTYAAFISKGKPVLHIEYSKDAPDVSASDDIKNDCGGRGTSGGAEGFSGVLKKMDLDDWVIECPS